jgi:hypothetical protein
MGEMPLPYATGMSLLCSDKTSSLIVAISLQRILGTALSRSFLVLVGLVTRVLVSRPVLFSATALNIFNARP